jgi:aspartate racemase
MLLAAFAALLYRYSGHDEVRIGIAPSTGKVPIAPNNAILFESVWPCCINLGGDQTLPDLTKRIGRQYSSALGTHGHRVIDPSATPSRGSVAGWEFAFHFSAAALAAVGSGVEKQSGFGTKVAEWGGNELAMRVTCTSTELKCTLEYNLELFDESTIRGMLRHFEVLLRGAAAKPLEPISTLPLLTEAERHILLQEWGKPPAPSCAPGPRPRFMHEMFMDQASAMPDAVAIVFEGQQLTYRELDERSNQLAHALRKRGAGPNVLVGICLERSPELVIGLLAILKAGAAFVPLEPSYPSGRLSALLAETGAAILVTDSRLLARFECGRQIVLSADMESTNIAAEPRACPDVQLTHECIAAVLFSSGSTGAPKAIPRPHRLFRLGSWVRSTFALSESDRHVFKTSLDSTLLAREVFWPLLTGGRMIIPGRQENSDARTLLRLISHHKITILALLPSLLRLLMAQEGFESCTSLRHVHCFGEPLPPDVEDSFCRSLPAQLSTFYGTTEALALAVRHCGGPSARPLGNLGHRLGNAEVYILDGRFQLVPIGVPGELFAGGPSMAMEYLNRPQQTEERFVPHPFDQCPGALLYRTGDRARWRSDGSLEFLGRLDEQVKIRGYRVEPAEIESALACHPAVLESAVLARPNSLGENELVAFLVLKKPGQTTSELRTYLKERLQEHMVPSRFSRLPTLPRKPNGKVDRKALSSSELDPLDLAEPFIAPRTSLEEGLADIWRDLLGVEQVGVNDDFFDLGGNSLVAVRLLARVEEMFRVNVAPTSLILAPTVRQLASVIQLSDQSPPPVLLKLSSGGVAPPLFGFPGAYWKERMVLGHGLALAALSRQIGDGYPFYGVTLGAVPTDIEPATLIGVLAGQALAEIRAIRPHGPYLLAGYSQGGLVALEVARKLLAAGEAVPVLAFLDVFGPGFPRLRGALGKIRQHLSRIRPLSFRARVGYIKERLRSRSVSSRHRKAIKSNESGDISELVRVASSAFLERQQHYPGRIQLFRAAVRQDTVSLAYDDPTCGWGNIAGGGVEVWQVAGTHDTMLDPPNLAPLASAIRSCIEAACPESSHDASRP